MDLLIHIIPITQNTIVIIYCDLIDINFLFDIYIVLSFQLAFQVE